MSGISCDFPPAQATECEEVRHRVGFETTNVSAPAVLLQGSCSETVRTELAKGNSPARHVIPPCVPTGQGLEGHRGGGSTRCPVGGGMRVSVRAFDGLGALLSGRCVTSVRELRQGGERGGPL